MWSLSQTVLKKSLTLIGWNDWYGSVFQVLHQPKPYMTDGHPDAIELQQAEAWGRELGERAQKIAVGDTKLIPEIPTGDNADTLWLYRGGNAGFMAAGARALPGSNGRLPGAAAAPGAAGAKQGPGPAPGGGPPGGMPMPLPSMVNVLPTIDMSKCVYPRCDACADACPVNAIDFSVNAPGRLSSGSNLLIKNACVSCSLCERMCIYDAAIHEGNGVRPKTTHAIDMKKCTYPKCTLCIDHCPMNSIDFSARPPVFHHNCEGCDLCYCICPTGAVSIPNINETQIAMRHIKGTGGAEEALNKAAAKGKFRWDVKPEDVGWDTPIFTNMNTPRIILDDLTGNTIYCDKPCKL
jgi:formate hydrogenlyase subunit 6/NADH:ubiquinone oxidoreductase subunit I